MIGSTYSGTGVGEGEGVGVAVGSGEGVGSEDSGGVVSEGVVCCSSDVCDGAVHVTAPVVPIVFLLSQAQQKTDELTIVIASNTGRKLRFIPEVPIFRVFHII
jgi:hypothetical protein